jgi:predicted metal-dependent hydrolase
MIVDNLPIKVVKSQRKTVSIYVERDGSVSALVPEKLRDEEIKNIIITKKYLIHKHLAEWTLLNEAKVDRDFVNGQSFLYLGKNYRLSLINTETNGLEFSKGRFMLPKSKVLIANDLFKQFYKNKLVEKLPPIIKRFESKLGVKTNNFLVMELQNRWASCSPKSNIHFHWKCAMAPIDVLNYIVAHELTHLIHPNHTHEFWNELDKVMPNYTEQDNWLKRNGVKMAL